MPTKPSINNHTLSYKNLVIFISKAELSKPNLGGGSLCIWIKNLGLISCLLSLMLPWWFWSVVLLFPSFRLEVYPSIQRAAVSCYITVIPDMKFHGKTGHPSSVNSLLSVIIFFLTFVKVIQLLSFCCPFRKNLLQYFLCLATPQFLIYVKMYVCLCLCLFL